MLLYGTSKIKLNGHLEIGGCDTMDLVNKWQTPLYVFDEQHIRNRIKEYKESFKKLNCRFRIGYASKAFTSMAMCRLIHEEGLLLDVVSSGELYTALQADFPPDRIYFHGNNKLIEELKYAVESGIRCFVIDSFQEIERLNHLASVYKKTLAVFLRVNPGVEAHTHAYISTGQEDSKFGFDVSSGQALQAVKMIKNVSTLILQGLHCHIGSQIFDTHAFGLAISVMASFAHECYQKYNLVFSVLNVGGGFGIRYDKSDHPKPLFLYLEVIVNAVKKYFNYLPDLPEIWIEPGRSLIGEAGTTLYTIGTIKDIPGIRRYVSVDGGMTDHIRTALYQARYEALLANKANHPVTDLVSVAGRCCESGDILIWDLHLPPVCIDDILAVSCTGAYHYSMASNYNRIPRPAVVFVKDGHDDLVVRRESLEDLVKCDILPESLAYDHKSY